MPQNAEIEANRRGCMTEQQKSVIREEYAKEIAVDCLYAGPLLFFLTISLLRIFNKLDLLLLCLISLLISMFLFSVFKLAQVILEFDLRKGRVQSVIGIVELQEHMPPIRRYTKTIYCVTLKQRKIEFVVKQGFFYSLINGKRYTLYYTPRTKIILSAELLDDAPRK
ncbi:MAG: hypothetical protein JXB47_18880 [Anaerolineae bacterium]|nr:hypothetical protein [Anaerolineae bacterium]